MDSEQSYSPEYCLALEAVYGTNMMSEGGEDGLKQFFKNIDLNNKSVLDIGSGLGGLCQYVDQVSDANIVGIDVNHWMIAEATRRQPHLQFQIFDGQHLPFKENHFDLIVSKGVFAHVANKAVLFKQIHHSLKPNGQFVFNDWLSSTHQQWSPAIAAMGETEGLSMFAVDITHYQALITQAQFNINTHRDETQLYAQYNQDIVDWLKQADHADRFIKRYGKSEYQEYLAGYQAITDEMRANRLQVHQFICSVA